MNGRSLWWASPLWDHTPVVESQRLLSNTSLPRWPASPFAWVTAMAPDLVFLLSCSSLHSSAQQPAWSFPAGSCHFLFRWLPVFHKAKTKILTQDWRSRPCSLPGSLSSTDHCCLHPRASQGLMGTSPLERALAGTLFPGITALLSSLGWNVASPQSIPRPLYLKLQATQTPAYPLPVSSPTALTHPATCHILTVCCMSFLSSVPLNTATTSELKEGRNVCPFGSLVSPEHREFSIYLVHAKQMC